MQSVPWSRSAGEAHHRSVTPGFSSVKAEKAEKSAAIMSTDLAFLILAQDCGAGSPQILPELDEERTYGCRGRSSQGDPLQTFA